MYSREEINELVTVQSMSNCLTHKTGPVILHWRGKSHRITNIGIHHKIREGRTLFHIFSVFDGSTYFKLKYDTDTLSWTLLEIGTE